MPDWMVAETFLFLWDDDEIAGLFRLRQYLNDATLQNVILEEVEEIVMINKIKIGSLLIQH